MSDEVFTGELALTRNQRKIIYFVFRKHLAFGFDRFVPLHSGNFAKNTARADKDRLTELGLLLCGNSYRVGHYSKSFRLTKRGIEVASLIQDEDFKRKRKGYNKVSVQVPDAAFRVAEGLVAEDLAGEIRQLKTPKAQDNARRKAAERLDKILQALTEIRTLGFVEELRKHKQCRGSSPIANLPDEVIAELLIEGEPVAVYDLSACYALGLYAASKGSVCEQESKALADWLDAGTFYEHTVGRELKKKIWMVLNDWRHRYYPEYDMALQLLRKALPETTGYISRELGQDRRFFLNVSTKVEAEIRNEVYRQAKRIGLPVLNKHDALVCQRARSDELIEVIHQSVRKVVGIDGHVKTTTPNTIAASNGCFPTQCESATTLPFLLRDEAKQRELRCGTTYNRTRRIRMEPKVEPTNRLTDEECEDLCRTLHRDVVVRIGRCPKDCYWCEIERSDGKELVSE